MSRHEIMVERFVKYLAATELALYDPTASGSRRATHMQLYRPFCLGNRALIKTMYGMTWKEGVKPGQKGPVFRDFTDFILKEGLRIHLAQQLGKDISEVEVTYNEKKDTKSRNEQPGTRGINFWRINETPKPWTEPVEPDPMSGTVPEDAPMSAPVAMPPKRVAEPLVRENKRARKAPERLPGMVTGATAVKAVGDSTKGRHPIHKA